MTLSIIIWAIVALVILNWLSYAVFEKSLLNAIIDGSSSNDTKPKPISKDLIKYDAEKFPLSFFIPYNLKSNIGYTINNPFRGVLIVGGAGSGKTETFVKNIIEGALSKAYSGIIYDYKYPSLTNIVYGIEATYGDNGVKTYTINFEDLKNSNRVNPLHPMYLKSVAYAEEYASTIINNLMPETIKKPDFWSRSAIALLQATIWYFKEHHPDKCNLPNVVMFIQQPIGKVLETLRTDIMCKQLISSILTAYDNKADGQLSGTVGTLQIALNKINTPEITYILSGNDFILDLNDPKEPKRLCIGNSPQMQETYGPVISLICTVALKMMNADNKHHSFVLLDEAPTLYIPRLETVPATGRERKIAVIYIAQDISQIIDRYGKEKKDTIIANLANQFWGRVSHHETAEYISKLFGKEEIVRRSYTEGTNTGNSSNTGFSGSGGSFGSSGSNSNSSSFTDSIVDKEVLKTTDIYQFTPGKFAYIIVDYQKANISGVKQFYYNSNFMQYERKTVDFGKEDIDVISHYIYMQNEIEHVSNLLSIGNTNEQQVENKKDNGMELF